MKKVIGEKGKWYIAALLGCFAFPVGAVWLAVNTLKAFKTRREKESAILYSAIGALIFALFMTGDVLFVSLASGKAYPYLVFMYIPSFAVAAYLFCVYGFHARRSRYLSRIYSLVQRDHITSLPLISEIMGISEEKTAEYLRILIRMGELRSARVDRDLGELILTECLWARQRVVCQNCGAELTVNFGQTLVCAYCGGALRVRRAE